MGLAGVALGPDAKAYLSYTIRAMDKEAVCNTADGSQAPGRLSRAGKVETTPTRN